MHRMRSGGVYVIRVIRLQGYPAIFLKQPYWCGIIDMLKIMSRGGAAMITREQIYGKEAMEILRFITTYHCIHRKHLLRIYPDKERQVDNLLKYLLR